MDFFYIFPTMYILINKGHGFWQTIVPGALLAVTFLMLSTLFPSVVSADVVIRCEHIHSGDTIPAGFGAPYEVFNNSNNAFGVNCGTPINFVIDESLTHYIYKTGYVWKDGAWQPITLSNADNPSGPWLLGAAKADLPFTTADLSTENYVVAYICQQINGVWKCGCRDQACTESYWQLQSFSLSQ